MSNNKQKTKSLSRYEMLRKLNENGDLNTYFDFGKEGIFHIVFESIITVYLLELMATLSKFFLIDPTYLPNPILYVFLPSILIIPIALAFTLFYIHRFIKIAYNYSCLDVEKQIDDLLDRKGILYNRLLLIHIWGFVLYCIASIGIVILLKNKYIDYIIDRDLFVIVLPLIGSIFGVIWNITGFYRDLRFFLARLLLKSRNKKMERQKKAIQLYQIQLSWEWVFSYLFIYCLRCYPDEYQ